MYLLRNTKGNILVSVSNCDGQGSNNNCKPLELCSQNYLKSSVRLLPNNHTR